MDGGFGLLVSVGGDTLVDASAVHVRAVDGQRGRGLVTAAHEDVLAVGEDLLSTGGVPIDVLCLSNNCGGGGRRFRNLGKTTFLCLLVYSCSCE